VIMPGPILNTNGQIMCPHGGTVTIAPAGKRPSAGGGMLVTIADVFTVAGCPFQIPATPPIPSPCVLVRYSAGESKFTIENIPAVSVSSVGLCYAATQAPQGTAIVASPGQQKVSAS
jgi:hypothetical protein